MSTSPHLTIDELPYDGDGALVGMYHVRHREGGLVEEVGDRAIGSFELIRIEAAYGAGVHITPADAETAEACARLVFERTKDKARAKALRALFAKPKAPREPKKGSVKKATPPPSSGNAATKSEASE